MNRLDAIERAKMYLENLASGVNPLTGEAVPEGDTVTNPRLKRCFEFVSEVLGEVIESGGKKKTRRRQREPFRISPEVLEAYIPTVTPLTVSEFVSRINAIASDEGKGSGRLVRTDVIAWLVAEGFLEEREILSGGKAKRSRYPTPAGKELGIITSEKTNRQGERYTVVLYSKAAQQFIADNIAAVCRPPEENGGVGNKAADGFNPQKDRIMINMYEGGAPVGAIAAALKLSQADIINRLHDLGEIE